MNGFIFNSKSDKVPIGLAGFPPTICPSAILFITTDPAAIITLEPMVTPASIKELLPIYTLLPIFILPKKSIVGYLFLNTQAAPCVKNLVPDVIST